MMSDGILTQTPPPQRQRSAFELLFSALPKQERVAQMATTLAVLKTGRLSLAGLVEARRDDKSVGVVWASPMPGQAVLLWPPQIVASEQEQTAQALLRSVDDFMRQAGLTLAYAYLADDLGNEAKRLRNAGYDRIAEILYLVSQQSDFPTELGKAEIEFEAFNETEQNRLAVLIEQTYQDSLDCPGIDGKRKIHDILDGYRQTGDYSPDRWFIARREDRDVACLLLSDHPGDDQWELVYQGVVPAERGRGWGLTLTRFAQWLTLQAGRARLVLAVDAQNHPAIRGYTEAGFQPWDRRYVFIRQVGDLPQPDES